MFGDDKNQETSGGIELAEALKRQIKIARGTGDVTREASVVTQARTLSQRVEQQLRQEIMSLDQLSRELGAPSGRVVAVLRDNKGKVHNVGTQDRPRWTWKIGDQTPTRELWAVGDRRKADHPLNTAQRVGATGAPAGRAGPGRSATRRRPGSCRRWCTA